MKLSTFFAPKTEYELLSTTLEGVNLKKESALRRSFRLLKRKREKHQTSPVAREPLLRRTTSEARLHRPSRSASSVGCFPQSRLRSASSCPVRSRIAFENKRLQVGRELDLQKQLDSSKALKLLTGLKVTDL
ncbi:hypothetical protein QR680_012585 [Steinernema hermaphroditum]|uniref:Uncharacterized protein n=1 Tax=Steinernema hermaphroditum TaxID=289476 RepID=A0AA39I2G7_9BILA|nr:hypothetical protein QR680_012585 [Steinernema hermaphroditum]